MHGRRGADEPTAPVELGAEPHVPVGGVVRAKFGGGIRSIGGRIRGAEAHESSDGVTVDVGGKRDGNGRGWGDGGGGDGVQGGAFGEEWNGGGGDELRHGEEWNGERGCGRGGSSRGGSVAGRVSGSRKDPVLVHVVGWRRGGFGVDGAGAGSGAGTAGIEQQRRGVIRSEPGDRETDGEGGRCEQRSDEDGGGWSGHSAAEAGAVTAGAISVDGKAVGGAVEAFISVPREHVVRWEQHTTRSERDQRGVKRQRW